MKTEVKQMEVSGFRNKIFNLRNNKGTLKGLQANLKHFFYIKSLT